ncbi:hypothetical protein DUI87_07642 [Hirundo rustica rustica]|uniref:Uncharacterized protein n=1 Tax=Hirundo rustica rustica TaxID=333673 RepID=A0A3M0KXD1_HIRRU|nr:hypothetical protein DUI87_07642 [Hirundo rustica rustica]
MPEKRKGAQAINEKLDNHLLRRDEEKSLEKEKKEARTAAKCQVEEYDTLDSPSVTKGKEGDGLVGIPAMSILIVPHLPVGLSKFSHKRLYIAE